MLDIIQMIHFFSKDILEELTTEEQKRSLLFFFFILTNIATISIISLQEKELAKITKRIVFLSM